MPIRKPKYPRVHQVSLAMQNRWMSNTSKTRRERRFPSVVNRANTNAENAENAERGGELREATAEELANRPKLQLKKRETPVGESTSSPSSLFGGARPREEALKASGKDWLEEDKRIEEAKLAEKNTCRSRVR